MHIVTYRVNRCVWPLAKPPHVAPIPWAMPKAVDVDGRWPISQGNAMWRKHAKLDGLERLDTNGC